MVPKSKSNLDSAVQQSQKAALQNRSALSSLCTYHIWQEKAGLYTPFGIL